MKTHKISRKAFHAMIAVMVIALASTLVSASLLTYFGQVTTTANVEQAVVIGDNTGWHNYNEPITYTIPKAAPGGETFCFTQLIWNKASIPVAVSLDTNAYEGITTSYSIPAVYSYSHNIAGVNVTVVDTGDGWLQWTYTYAAVPTHTPKMTVAINYPTGFAITTFDGQTDPATGQPYNGWYYAPDGGAVVYLGVYSGYTGTTVKTTAVGNVLTVKILKSALGNIGDSFKWHGYANYNGAQVWINPDQDGIWHASLFVVNFWGAPLTAPFTVQSQQQLPFRICYAFDLSIGPGQYILTTTVDANKL